MFRHAAISFTVILSFVFIQFPLLSIQSSTPKSSKYQAQQFKRNLDKIIEEYAGKSNVGVEVVSLRSGLRLYQKNAENLFIPASCLKLFTGASALAMLGPDYTFATTIWTDGQIVDKKLQGNIYIKGTGDPELQSKNLEELVFQLKLAGIEEITGTLYVDNSDFDGVTQGPGWMWDDEPEYWNSPMDALTVNHSCLKLWICPGDDCSKPAKIFVHPKTSFVSVENLSKTIEETNSNLAVFRRVAASKNLIQIKGVIAKTSEPITYEVSLDQPHLYTGHLFLEMLGKQNITISSGIEEKQIPENGIQLAEYRSRPIALIVQKMMKDSDNLYADCLFKKTGQRRFGTMGSWSNASQAVREFLAHKIGLNTSEMVVLDGSGLSRYNLVSPRQFVQFLIEIKKSYPYATEFLASLPISGVDGSLKMAMDDGRLLSKVKAKTGSMRGVRTISGYVTTKEGEELAFSIMINGFIEPRPKESRLENEICKYMAMYSRE